MRRRQSRRHLRCQTPSLPHPLQAFGVTPPPHRSIFRAWNDYLARESGPMEPGWRQAIALERMWTPLNTFLAHFSALNERARPRGRVRLAQLLIAAAGLLRTGKVGCGGTEKPFSSWPLILNQLQPPCYRSQGQVARSEDESFASSCDLNAWAACCSKELIGMA